ncbi:septum formation inhibitor-activating ATPase [Rhizobium leguminosarum]|uniref:septum formation inhibitor-activating ATPase n=1 Tax=Rhizobium leguminosarum TaxID=384 RepID=UPI001C8FE08C|nr:septum formation inhibitor-activating ATPase [Rhizobium leguminosarum]MBY2986677.1 septum formation inhibitor-activating ATPase [Rhizobium leguminosarum]
MPVSLTELLDEAASREEPQITSKIGISPGGVDPLGLRQINFGLMDRVFPDLNNVARHIRPYVIMAWAWRRVRRILEKDKRKGATDLEMRDFVDRIEAIYAWSQFLVDPHADLPGAVAMRELLDAESYVFGGEEWERRRDMRRYSTGLISPLNYGPSLQTMGWIKKADEGVGVFGTPLELDPVLDAFERKLESELDHPAFSRFGRVRVKREDAERWGKLWSMEKPLKAEREALYERLGGSKASASRQQGIALVRAGFEDLGSEDYDVEEIRARMSDPPQAWDNSDARPATASDWRAVQVRQVFRLALEGLFFWTVATLGDGPMHSRALADEFLAELGKAQIPETAATWLLPSRVNRNPVKVLKLIKAALRSRDEIAPAILAGLRHSLREAPAESLEFETFDRLPLARAHKEAEQWRDLTPREFLVRAIETWVMAQHTYWCVNRGLADARGRGKTILRLRIVMDEGGWTQTPGTTLGNPPEATPDRLETALYLLRECRAL